MDSRIKNGRLKIAWYFYRCTTGFTLIELLVVMAIIATLLSIAAPSYFESVNRAKETVLKTDLKVFREAIDKYHADTGKLPSALKNLVDARYIRDIPIDPITDLATTWVPVESPDVLNPGIVDVRSGAAYIARDGTNAADW